MKDPKPLVDHCYEMQVEGYLNTMRDYGYHPSIDEDLFKSLYTESTVELPGDLLHNKYINEYNHYIVETEEIPRDRSPIYIYIPSRLYLFFGIKEEIVQGVFKNQATEIPECTIAIHEPDEAVTTSLLHTCRTISEHQPVTDLRMLSVHYKDKTAAEAPKLSKHTQSIYLNQCSLQTSFMRDSFQQLHNCVTLSRLELRLIDLREVEEDLNKLLDNLVSNHMKGLSQTKLKLWITKHELSREFREKWRKRCYEIPSIDCYITAT